MVVPEREPFIGDIRVCISREERYERIEIFVVDTGFVAEKMLPIHRFVDSIWVRQGGIP